jgi:hypothetical protein
VVQLEHALDPDVFWKRLTDDSIVQCENSTGFRSFNAEFIFKNIARRVAFVLYTCFEYGHAEFFHGTAVIGHTMKLILFLDTESL